MDAVVAARLLAIPTGVGAVALPWFDAWAASVVLGAATVALLVAAVRPAAPDAGPTGAAPLVALLRALELRGPGIHAPGASGARLFVPPDDAVSRVPALDDGRVLHRQAPAALGAAVPSLGDPLYRAWADRRPIPAGAGQEEAARQVRAGLAGMALGSNVRFEAAGARLRVRWTPTDAAACEAARTAGWHDLVGCPTCSFAAALVAQGLGAPVRFAGCETQDGDVVLSLEALPRA